MTLFRPEARAALYRWREVIIAGTVAAFGLWLIALGGLLLIPIGAAVLAFAAVLARMAWRRVRFQQPGAGPGLVEVDEGQVGYMGPTFGGYVSLPDLAELRLLTLHGQRLWRLKQADGQVLLIPVAATGAERLFDAFATLPDMDTQALLTALAPTPATGTAALLPHGTVIGPVIWRRPARAVLT